MIKLDDLIEQREKLTELLRYAEIYGGKVTLGDAFVTLPELKEMLNNVKIEIESRRSQTPPLRRVK